MHAEVADHAPTNSLDAHQLVHGAKRASHAIDLDRAGLGGTDPRQQREQLSGRRIQIDHAIHVSGPGARRRTRCQHRGTDHKGRPHETTKRAGGRSALEISGSDPPHLRLSVVAAHGCLFLQARRCDQPNLRPPNLGSRPAILWLGVRTQGQGQGAILPRRLANIAPSAIAVVRAILNTDPLLERTTDTDRIGVRADTDFVRRAGVGAQFSHEYLWEEPYAEGIRRAGTGVAPFNDAVATRLREVAAPGAGTRITVGARCASITNLATTRPGGEHERQQEQDHPSEPPREISRVRVVRN